MKRPTIDIDTFIRVADPCYSREQLEKIRGKKPLWSALDILRLKKISIDDKFFAVLREELIPAPILHEFACRCAERALARVDNPDPRSVAAIAAKRAWLKGEITDEQLGAARGAARSAAWDAEQQWQLDELIKMLEEPT